MICHILKLIRDVCFKCTVILIRLLSDLRFTYCTCMQGSPLNHTLVCMWNTVKYKPITDKLTFWKSLNCWYRLRRSSCCMARWMAIAGKFCSTSSWDRAIHRCTDFTKITTCNKYLVLDQEIQEWQQHQQKSIFYKLFQNRHTTHELRTAWVRGLEMAWLHLDFRLHVVPNIQTSLLFKTLQNLIMSITQAIFL